jgi:hypothetical protein
MRYRASATLVTMLTLSACSNGVGPESNAVLAANLRKVPTSVRVGEATLSLSASLWRDPLPVTSPGPSSLRGSFAIRTQSPTIFPPVTFDALWVVNGASVWKADIHFDPLADPAPGTILKVVENGPKWPSGTAVDVIAQVGLTDGSKRLLRASGLVIQPVY